MRADNVLKCVAGVTYFGRTPVVIRPGYPLHI